MERAFLTQSLGWRASWDSFPQKTSLQMLGDDFITDEQLSSMSACDDDPLSHDMSDFDDAPNTPISSIFEEPFGTGELFPETLNLHVSARGAAPSPPNTPAIAGSASPKLASGIITEDGRATRARFTQAQVQAQVQLRPQAALYDTVQPFPMQGEIVPSLFDVPFPSNAEASENARLNSHLVQQPVISQPVAVRATRSNSPTQPVASPNSPTLRATRSASSQGNSSSLPFGQTPQPPPNMQGTHFALAMPLVANQQRERIAICPESQYPLLVLTGTLPDTDCIVVAHAIGYNTEDQIQVQASLNSWPPNATQLEIRAKTPDLLSNTLDLGSHGATAFYFVFKIYAFVPDTLSYIFYDQVTSNTFRTVSHSKLCDIKRRSAGPRKRQGKKRRTGDDEDEE
jgi:hypothetical protein